MRSVHLRIIGDVHGRILDRVRKVDRDRDRRCMPAIWRDPRLRGRSYLRLAREARHSIQVGDLSLDYSELGELDSECHRVVAGNHDRLPNLSPHFLGDFGTHSIPLAEGRLELFFARGAASIDRMTRIEGLNWWPEEELDLQQQSNAIASYSNTRPRFVVTHDCPTELVTMIATQLHKLPPSQTNAMLQTMFESHAPQWWFFGHHHRNWVFQHPRGTRFVCLGSLAYFDFDETGRSISWKPE